MMLFINTSDDARISLAIVTEKAIGRLSYNKPREVSETLAVEISRFLKKRKVSFKYLTKIGVVVGPGHFSRVRTGVATANALGFALNLPVVGIKQTEIGNLRSLLAKKGQKSVKPFYLKGPNITKSKSKKLKI